MVLNKESFKKIKLAEEVVIIPELEDGKLIVRQLSAKAMADYYIAGEADQKDGRQTLREHLIVRSLFNENGERVFADDDVDFVSSLPQKVVVKLYSVASRLSPMGDPDEDKKEKALKNSKAPSTDSSITSPSEQDASTSD